ncbi:MAG: MarR family transcriptional regulator [Sphingomonadales bacterium]
MMSIEVKLAPEISRKVGNACLCFQTQRAARALARHFDEVFRPLGITNGQFSLMMSLNRPDGAPTMQQVADSLAMDRTTLTAALKPLERRGLVAVTVDERDRRNRRLSLTPAGHRLLTEAVPLWETEHDAVEARLGGIDADSLRDALRAISALG